MTEENWTALETDIVNGELRPPVRESRPGDLNAKTQKFPCGHCGGSGNWRGRGKCYACGGKGYFLHSEQDRRKARAQRSDRKARKLAMDRRTFDEANPGIAAFLTGASTWSSFARDLGDKLGQYGSLTDGQVRAVRSMMEKTAAAKAAKAVEREAAKQTVDLSPIRAMFEAARSRGHKKPVYRAAGLIIKRASDIGRNPGALYVSDENEEYLGKIVGTEYTGRPAPALQAIAADPRGEAVRYGQRTGNCSCCGRELTVEASINAGIGPVCAAKWGLA